MQQGSSLVHNSPGTNISHERKILISTALGSATAMCRGIESIAQLTLNEGQVSMDDMECIFTLVRDLSVRLQHVHAEISA